MSGGSALLRAPKALVASLLEVFRMAFQTKRISASWALPEIHDKRIQAYRARFPSNIVRDRSKLASLRLLWAWGLRPFIRNSPALAVRSSTKERRFSTEREDWVAAGG